MKVNYDLMRVMRATPRRVRQQRESGEIVATCLFLCLVMLTLTIVTKMFQ